MVGRDEFRRRFPRVPASAAGVRQFVSETLGGCAAQFDFQAAVLLADELATNAIVHASGDAFVLVVMVESGAVRIAVEDEDPTPPQLKERGERDIGGLGLPIVGALSDSWGVCATPGGKGGGKWVWFQLKRSPG